MSLVQRVAAAAAATFTVVALALTSTPGLAAQAETPAPVINTSASAEVPAPAPSLAPAVAVEQAGDTVAYPTLDAAVAAQNDRDGDEAAVQCLAGAIYHESKGEPLAGQLAVADVIINRSQSGRFPADVCKVVLQRGQFGFVRGGRIPDVNEDSRQYRTAVAVARVALADAWNSAADEALYFNTPSRKPASGLRRVALIGNHAFWR